MSDTIWSNIIATDAVDYIKDLTGKYAEIYKVEETQNSLINDDIWTVYNDYICDLNVLRDIIPSNINVTNVAVVEQTNEELLKLSKLLLFGSHSEII